jgi:hypothetical protein
MSRQRIQTFSLLLIAVGMLPVGVQASFAPRSFFEDFPLGRGWIAQEGGAYNEHLVRDVGVLFLAMVIVTTWTALRLRPARPIAVAWLVEGVLHIVYHAGHLDGYKTIDKVGMIGSLALVPVLALIVLWAGRPTSPENA